jgi:hypothetical protein
MLAGLVPGPGAPMASAGAPARQILFGAYPRERAGETERQAVERIEGQIDRPLAVVREFALWDSDFPTGYHDWLAQSDHPMFFSVKSKRTTGVVRWRDIADAPKGSTLHGQIVDWARSIRDYPEHVFFTFNHEPEAAASDPMGDHVDYIDAWRRIHRIFDRKGATNVTWIWIMTDFAFDLPPNDARGRYAPLWYPGDRWVDGMAIDAYNWHWCRVEDDIKNNWESLEHIADNDSSSSILGFRDFAAQHPAEGAYLAEWATVENSGAQPGATQTKAQWISEAASYLKGWDQLQGILYFNTTDKFYHSCRWWIDTSTGSLNAFRAMANDPFYGGVDPG